MKLACLRCKQKKIKCDKAEPICHQCVTAKHTDCVYVERRKRPRLAQQKLEVRSLSRRLEFLERRISSGETISPSSHHDCSPEESVTAASPQLNSPEEALSTEGGHDSWIYRMATDAKRNFEKVNTHPQNTPSNANATPVPYLDNAMSALSEALEDLGKLRVRSDNGVPKSSALKLSKTQARECIDSFIDLLNTMVVPGVFTGNLDLKSLRAMPEIEELASPFVRIDPALRIMYYNALYYGLYQTQGGGSHLAQLAYMKAIETVPSWLDSATGTTLDAHTAALTAWTAINNLDYQLSWKFHIKSCQFIKILGIDHLDVVFPRTQEEENKRQEQRYLYWQIIQTDLLFRIFYGKPSAIAWSPNAVKPPTTFSSSNMEPGYTRVILLVAWAVVSIIINY